MVSLSKLSTIYRVFLKVWAAVLNAGIPRQIYFLKHFANRLSFIKHHILENLLYLFWAVNMAINENQEKPVVLVVDDNPQNLELLLAYIEDVDCTTISASSGQEALDIIKKMKPDLVLLDVMMPKISGFEVCKRVKNDQSTADIPIIMVTALSELADIEKAINSGTDDFLSKPVNKWELVTRVKTMLKLKHLTDRLERTMAYLNEVEKATHAR